MTGVDFDRVLKKVGAKGKFQTRVFLLLCFPASLPAVSQLFSQIFVSAKPEFWCNDFNTTLGSAAQDLNLTYLPRSQCYVNETNHSIRKCTKWEYSRTHFDETLVTKFNLVCDDSSLPERATSMFYLGSIFGTVFFGWASDRWGRKLMMMPVLLIPVFFTLLTCFVTNYMTYGILRFICGLFFPAIYQIPFVLAMELLGPGQRTAGGIIMSILFALSEIVFALIAFLTRRWSYLIMSVTLPQILFISFFWLIPESPRWLLSKNKIDEAEAIVRKMAKVNRVNLPSNYLLKLQEVSKEEEIVAPSTVSSHWDLLRYTNTRWRYLIILYNWMVNAFIYHGLSYFSDHLGINMFGAFAMMGAMEALSCLLAWWGMEKFGRRSILFACMMFGGLSCIASVLVEENVWAVVTAVMFGKLLCSAGFNVFYLYVAELLPTVVRARAMSIASVVSSVSLLIFPYVINLKSQSKVLPLVIMGTLSIIGAAAVTVLPETRHMSLFQTFEDSERIPLDFTFFRKTKSKLKNREDALNDPCITYSVIK